MSVVLYFTGTFIRNGKYWYLMISLSPRSVIDYIKVLKKLSKRYVMI